MGLMIVVDWLVGRNLARGSLVLWILLAAAVGLTYWECRERGYSTRVLLWWVSFVALTHAVGFVILRFVVRPPRGD